MIHLTQNIVSSNIFLFILNSGNFRNRYNIDFRKNKLKRIISTKIGENEVLIFF